MCCWACERWQLVKEVLSAKLNASQDILPTEERTTSDIKDERSALLVVENEFQAGGGLKASEYVAKQRQASLPAPSESDFRQQWENRQPLHLIEESRAAGREGIHEHGTVQIAVAALT